MSRRPPETNIFQMRKAVSPFSRCEKAKYGKPRASLPANQPRVLFSVVDLVSADLEEVAQKCGLSYKVKLTISMLQTWVSSKTHP